MSEHIASQKLYFIVFFSLLILTVLTWRIAYIDLGRWNMVVALLISICKTGLVGMFFMHLRWSTSMVRLVVFAAIFWLAIMMTLTLGDFFTRNAVSHPQGWQASIVVPRPAAPAPSR
ncbi:MAG TPA: cytochrome C oxidase subunit IV family protein [Terriglobia bacterium]|nr:cytochrome C oxidase subunit IV family protein [Terriglobia bacterium]